MGGGQSKGKIGPRREAGMAAESSTVLNPILGCGDVLEPFYI